MPQSLVQLYVHLVFSTKDRKPVFQDLQFRERLHGYFVGACDGQACPSLRVGGTDDHVHLLVRLGKTIDVASLIRDLKRESSKWVKSESRLRTFNWQRGYGAFSISPSHVDATIEYIKNQEAHHKKVSFKEEFRRICMKYKIDIDERYVWD